MVVQLIGIKFCDRRTVVVPQFMGVLMPNLYQRQFASVTTSTEY